jgi:peptide/nickel transport system permease protein
VKVGKYILRRLLQAVPTLFIVSLVLFALVNLAPGGPLAGHTRGRQGAQERTEILKRQFGLDKPVWIQYVIWLVGNDWMRVDADGDGVNDSRGTRRGILRGDFGFSYRTRESVLDEIADKLPNTIYLMGITIIAVLAVAIPSASSLP